jgi:hypothetical protein
MNNQAYASGLLDAVIQLLSSSSRTKKDRRQTASVFFDGLNADTWIRPTLEEYGKNATTIVFSPFAVDAATVCSDLSATWKATGRGGACKMCTNFCSCCALISDNVQDANPCLCARFCLPNQGEKPDWKCFHTEILSEDVTSQQEMALKLILQNVVNERFKEVESWHPNCCLNNKEDPRVPTKFNTKIPS